MELLEYKEIYYTSSEKGIFSGRPGFGVRTCTRGMGSDEADTIINTCSPGYAVYNDRILDMEKITANPDVVYDYPPVYTYRTIEMNDGAKKFVMGRTVYLGVDYGYFKGINAYDRTGTNYFTHLFIFNEVPSASFFGRLIAGSKFVPSNYSCSPSNVELQGLLTGAPEFLKPGTMEFDSGITDPVCPEGTELFLMGVVQMLKNQSFPAEMDVPRKMYVKCPWKHVEDCINALSMFVKADSESFHFTSNYMQGYGIPDGYEIVFVNEFNTVELYEDSCVAVDLFNEEIKNVERNYITERITDLIHQKDLTTASQLIDFYIGLSSEKSSDYEFYYFVFEASISDMELRLENMPDAFIQKLTGIQLTEEQSARLWSKVNQSVNDGLFSKTVKGFLHTIDQIKVMGEIFPEKMQIQEESVRHVTNVLFNGKGIFGKIVNEDNVTTLLQIVDKERIPSEIQFLKSVGESADYRVWLECLTFYYDSPCADISPAVYAIVHSPLSEDDVNSLLEVLFPLNKYADQLFEFYKNNRTEVVKAKDNFKSLFRYYDEKRFADFVQMSSVTSELQTIVAQEIIEYYEGKINENAYEGIMSLFSFLYKAGPNQVTKLSMWPMLRKAAKSILMEPKENITVFIDKLKEMDISFPKGQDDEIELLTCLVNKEVPKKVDKAFVHAIFQNYPDDIPYFTTVFLAWIKNGAGKDEVKDFITRDRMDNEMVMLLVNSVWESRSFKVRNNREKLVLAVLDNCGWSRCMVDDFGRTYCKAELKKFVLKHNTFLRRLLRKM